MRRAESAGDDDFPKSSIEEIAQNPVTAHVHFTRSVHVAGDIGAPWQSFLGSTSDRQMFLQGPSMCSPGSVRGHQRVDG